MLNLHKFYNLSFRNSRYKNGITKTRFLMFSFVP
jgi:hypothetical protein